MGQPQTKSFADVTVKSHPTPREWCTPRRSMTMRCLLLLLLAATLVAEEDLYAISASTTPRTSAKSGRLRKLSLKHHLDKGGDTQLFKKVTSAYEVLSDGDKRALYDAGGMDAVEKGTGGRDPFGRPVGVQRGHDVSVTVDVPLEDMYKGGSVRAAINRRVVCRGCSTTPRGQPPPDRCAGCSASCPPVTKVVQRRMGMMIMNQEVQEPSKERCKEDQKVLHAEIERGAAEMSEIVFPRQASRRRARSPATSSCDPVGGHACLAQRHRPADGPDDQPQASAAGL